MPPIPHFQKCDVPKNLFLSTGCRRWTSTSKSDGILSSELWSWRIRRIWCIPRLRQRTRKEWDADKGSLSWHTSIAMWVIIFKMCQFIPSFLGRRMSWNFTSLVIPGSSLQDNAAGRDCRGNWRPPVPPVFFCQTPEGVAPGRLEAGKNGREHSCDAGQARSEKKRLMKSLHIFLFNFWRLQ